MLRKLREPVNSLTHWGGASLALIGLIALLIVGWGTPVKIISLLVYGISLLFFYFLQVPRITWYRLKKRLWKFFARSTMPRFIA